jgi:hypothetical protein
MKVTCLRRGLVIALSVLGLAASPAIADPINIACAGETVTIPGWGTGTMTVTYDGNNKGPLAVKGPHTGFSVPASSHKYASPLPPLVVEGKGDTKAIMPDFKTVDACAAGKMTPDLDPDAYSVLAVSCLEKAPASATPVPVNAQVTVTFLKDENSKALEPFVQMKVTYLEKSSSPTGSLAIELMPKDCKVIP